MPTMSTSQSVLDPATSSLYGGIPALNVGPETSGLCFRVLPSDNHPHRAKTTSIFEVFPSSSEQFPPISRAHSDGSHISENFSLRSTGGMQGLLLAEGGGGLVELDPLGGGSGFRQGTRVIPGLITPGGGAFAAAGQSRPRYRDAEKTMPSRVPSDDGATRRSLARRGTFLSHGATQMRKAAELKSLLGNSRAKVKSGAKIPSAPNLAAGGSPAGADVQAVVLEQGKSRARVEIDILLDSDICVEGHYLTGKLHVKVRKRATNDSPILLARGKIRVVGFEGIPGNNDRHTFFQHAASLSDISHSSQAVYASPPDEEGFSRAHEGLHVIPFAVKLPITDGVRGGAKGPFDNRSGVIVKYIIIASFKLKDGATSERSLAHFYRSCQVYPYLSASIVMGPASRPFISTAARNIFLGGQGKLKLAASLHRNFWVAGQRCFVGIAVQNDTKRSVKGLVISLIRTVTVFNPQPHLDVSESPQAADPDACQTTTTRKLVAETTLEAGQRGLRGHVTAKGWWTGVSPGTRTNFTHFILLPPDALSIVRSRLIEVQYDIRVSLVAGTLSSEVSVMLPVRIISHLSVDPPPSYPYLFDQRDGLANLVPPLCIPDIQSSTSVVPSPSRDNEIHDLDERGINGGLPSALDGSDSSKLGTSLAAAGQSSLNVPAHSALGIPLPRSLDEDPNSDASYATFYHSIHGIPEGARCQDIRRDKEDRSGQEGDSIIELCQDRVDDTIGDLCTEDSDEEIDLIVGSARLEDDAQFIPSFDGTYLGKEEETLRLPRRRALSTISSRSSYSTSSVENPTTSQMPILEKMSAQAAHEGPPARPGWGTEGSDGDGGSHDMPTPRAKASPPQRQMYAAYYRPPGSDFCSASTAAPNQASLFSQRVDRLIAVRRATVKAPLSSDAGDGSHGEGTLATLSTGGTSPQRDTSSSEMSPSPAATTQLAGQHQHCFGRCTQSVAPPSKTALSVSSSRAASALHGRNSVKARIAELEGMCNAVLSSNH